MLSELTLLTSCTCPGHEIVFECIINGDSATIWHGTVLALEECDNDNIFLRHSDFNTTGGYMINKSCGTIGQVTGRAVSALNQIFVSQLTLNFSQTLSIILTSIAAGVILLILFSIITVLLVIMKKYYTKKATNDAVTLVNFKTSI